MGSRNVTLRRTVQQIGHCVAEALAVIERDEDPACAVDDLEQALALLKQRAIPLVKELQEQKTTL